MPRPFIVGFAALLAAASVPSEASHLRKYFPLKKGNRWAYTQDRSIQMSKQSGSMIYVEGFPSLEEGFWAVYVGDTLYHWNKSQGKWNPFLEFSAATASGFDFVAGSNPLTKTRVTLMSKEVTDWNPLLKTTFKKCYYIRLVSSFIYPYQTTFDLFFAPNVGVSYLKIFGSTFFSSSPDFDLKSALLGGKPFGIVDWSSLAKGVLSTYAGGVSKGALLLKDMQAWTAFHNAHYPASPVPTYDFSKQTVLVVLGKGTYRKSGFKFDVESLRWNYPSKAVTVWVKESEPPLGGTSQWSRPYTIALLKGKVSGVNLVLNGLNVQNELAAP